MNLVDSRKFSHLTFGITISASDLDTEEMRFTDEDVNRLTFQEASHILREGGRIVLGHRWKPGGVMHHLASKARDFRTWKMRSDTVEEPPSIVNVIAWPDEPPSAADSTAMRLIEQRILEVQTVGVDGVDLTTVDRNSDLGRFCRTRSLTAMRKKITDLTDIRICLGGAGNKPDRRLPGVLEEVILTIQAGKPLYLSSALGGVSKVISDVLLQRRVSEEALTHFFTPASARDTMLQFQADHPYPLEEGPSIPGNSASDQWNALEDLRKVSLEDIAGTACLSMDEYVNLLTTADLNRAMTLVMQGAIRVRSK